MADAPDLKFTSREEFHAVCRSLAGRMHYLNRASMGEQGFAWTVAEVMAALGRVFEDHYDDPEVQKAFGDGWNSGTIARDERVKALMALAFPEKPAK